MARASLADEIAAVRAICHALGLGDVVPALLKAAHHTTLIVSPLGLVARVQSAEPTGSTHRRAVREIAVARHLAARGVPIVAPLEARLAGPHVVASQVVTLWPYLAHARTADESDAPLAAATLRGVHEGLRDYAGALPPYTETLDRCWRMLVDDRACAGLSEDDRDLLKAHYRRLRREVEAGTSVWTALHGDAYLGNLPVGGCGPVWIDFEDACVGSPTCRASASRCGAGRTSRAARRFARPPGIIWSGLEGWPSTEWYHLIRSPRACRRAALLLRTSGWTVLRQARQERYLPRHRLKAAPGTPACSCRIPARAPCRSAS